MFRRSQVQKWTWYARTHVRTPAHAHTNADAHHRCVPRTYICWRSYKRVSGQGGIPGFFYK